MRLHWVIDISLNILQRNQATMRLQWVIDISLNILQRNQATMRLHWDIDISLNILQRNQATMRLQWVIDISLNILQRNQATMRLQWVTAISLKLDRMNIISKSQADYLVLGRGLLYLYIIRSGATRTKYNTIWTRVCPPVGALNDIRDTSEIKIHVRKSWPVFPHTRCHWDTFKMKSLPY